MDKYLAITQWACGLVAIWLGIEAIMRKGRFDDPTTVIVLVVVGLAYFWLFRRVYGLASAKPEPKKQVRGKSVKELLNELEEGMAEYV